jgi:hypothetical protein
LLFQELSQNLFSEIDFLNLVFEIRFFRIDFMDSVWLKLFDCARRAGWSRRRGNAICGVGWERMIWSGHSDGSLFVVGRQGGRGRVGIWGFCFGLAGDEAR